MDLQLELTVEERQKDRVYISVMLAPDGQTIALDGVALQLFCRKGTPLSPRMLLPIAGALSHPMMTTVELRTSRGEHVSAGAKVVATAWNGDDSIELAVPTDAWTQLGSHMQGDNAVWNAEEAELEPLLPDERCRLAKAFPWVQCFHPHRVPLAVDNRVLDAEETTEEEELQEAVKSFCDDLGLSEDDASWLQDLLEEPDL